MTINPLFKFQKVLIVLISEHPDEDHECIDYRKVNYLFLNKNSENLGEHCIWSRKTDSYQLIT